MLILRLSGLAISGGVDSMALAYLCSRTHRFYMHMRVADNTVSQYHCVIVDHRLRDGSDQEARAVSDVLQHQLRLKPRVIPISWTETLKATSYSHPKELPNFETVARRLRFRRLADYCAQYNIASLLLAHHEDDQHETVLMRLLSGHGASGLLGMRAATDIPECHDVHSACRSGFLDDQASASPMINYRPTRADMRRLRTQVISDLDPDLTRKEILDDWRAGSMGETDMASYVPRTKWVLPAAPPQVEDGGIMVYRPLLEFGKDRLVATCEANGIPWFEDATNQDATLTMRNAVRHLYKNYTLPIALQKPAVLGMSRRLQRQAELHASEADRLLWRTVVKDFESTSGTVVVQLPSFRIPRLQRGRNRDARRMRRLEHYREIAALLLKKLIAIVTPQAPGPVNNNLQNTVLQLFPSLNSNPSKYPLPPKPFNVAGVQFTPVRARASFKTNGPHQWYLSRESYVSDRILPQCNFGRLPLHARWRRRAEQWRWPTHLPWELWDNRFWVTLCNRSPVHAAFAPFEAKHAKAFRESLPDARSRDELVELLKLHAPGKVRYTLPAIYTAGSIEEAMRDYGHVAEQEKNEVLGGAERRWGEKEATMQQGRAEKKVVYHRMGTREDWAKADNRVLVALPTLGIARPGLQNWMRYGVRYKRVDRRVLDESVGDEKELMLNEQLRRRARRRGGRRWWLRRCALKKKTPARNRRREAKKCRLKLAEMTV